MFGIIAALEKEVQDIKRAMADVLTTNVAGMTFYEGKIFEKPVVVVKSGVGKVNAAVCAQILIDRYGAEKLINVGVAGGVAMGLLVGDIIISSDSVQYDMDGTAFGHPRGEIPNMDITYFPADEELITLAEKAAESVGVRSRVGRVMTADFGVDSIEIKAGLTHLFGGACVEMEGAAIGQVAYMNNVPYIIIRSISDNADGKLMETYRQNLDQSVKNAGQMVLSMIKNS